MKINFLKTLLSLLSVFILTSLAWSSPEEQEMSILEGKELFFLNCASCHDKSQQKRIGKSPNLCYLDVLAHSPKDFIRHLAEKQREREQVPKASDFSNREVRQIISYLRDNHLGNPFKVEFQKAMNDLKAANYLQDILTGEKLFKRHCMACHDEGGKGKRGFSPSIRSHEFLAIASDDFIKHTIKKGRGGTYMLARPSLSDEQLNSIIKYLRNIPKDKQLNLKQEKPFVAKDGDRIVGAIIFKSYCGSCHGKSGGGYVKGGKAPGIGLIDFLNNASDDFIFKTLKHGRSGTEMRPFVGKRSISELSRKDVSDIITFLRSLHQKKSGIENQPQ